MWAFQDWLKQKRSNRGKSQCQEDHTKHWQCWDIGEMAFAIMARSTQWDTSQLWRSNMSAWDLSPCVIIVGTLGHPYKYTHQQITCTDVTMLQLLHTHIGTGTCSGYLMSTWCVYIPWAPWVYQYIHSCILYTLQVDIGELVYLPVTYQMILVDATIQLLI